MNPSPVTTWTPPGSSGWSIALATWSSLAEIGCAQDPIGKVQSRSAAAGISAASAADGGVSSPSPRYSFFAADGGALRSCAKERGLTEREMESAFFKDARPASLLQRFATVEEIADVIVFVASPLAAAINGSALRAEGGIVRSIA